MKLVLCLVAYLAVAQGFSFGSLFGFGSSDNSTAPAAPAGGNVDPRPPQPPTTGDRPQPPAEGEHPGFFGSLFGFGKRDNSTAPVAPPQPPAEGEHPGFFGSLFGFGKRDNSTAPVAPPQPPTNGERPQHPHGERPQAPATGGQPQPPSSDDTDSGMFDSLLSFFGFKKNPQPAKPTGEGSPKTGEQPAAPGSNSQVNIPSFPMPPQQGAGGNGGPMVPSNGQQQPQILPFPAAGGSGNNVPPQPQQPTDTGAATGQQGQHNRRQPTGPRQGDASPLQPLPSVTGNSGDAPAISA